MYRLIRILTLICVLVSVAAQRPLGEEGRNAIRAAIEKLGEYRMIANLDREQSRVLDDLNLTDEQREAISRINRQRQQQGWDKLEVAEQSREELRAVLDETQRKRLRQIYLQRSGYEVFANSVFAPALVDELGLSSEQLVRLQQVNQLYMDGINREWVEARKWGRRETEKLLKRLTEERDRQGEAVLTLAQKQKWIELLGKPIQFEFVLASPTLPTPERPVDVTYDKPIPLKAGEVAIEYIAHACFRIQSANGNRVIIDPYTSRVWVGYDFPSGLGTDAVLVTHAHYDHDWGESLGHPWLWGPGVREIRRPGNYAIGDISVLGVQGRHARDYGAAIGHHNTIWLVEVDGLRIVHAGDNESLTASTVEQLGHVDVLMLPIDSLNHILTADEVESIRSAIRPRYLVPMHYRIPELEPDPSLPRSLGPIDPWLKTQTDVIRLDGNVKILTRAALPETPSILVFRHSPRVQKPIESQN